MKAARHKVALTPILVKNTDPRLRKGQEFQLCIGLLVAKDLTHFITRSHHIPLQSKGLPLCAAGGAS